MKDRSLSQESLKIIACVTMLIDHVGASLFPAAVWMRIIGRIAFPIYCFLLSEGSHYTKNPKKYALRLFIGMLLAEIPFDMALFGGLTWQYQSVMVTLLLGFFALERMKQVNTYPRKLLCSLPFMLIAELLCTDYGGWGVALIVMFALFRDMPKGKLLQSLGLAAIVALMPSGHLAFHTPAKSYYISIELLAVAALPFILAYKGEKKTNSKFLQWAFYLFYPVHLLILWIIQAL